jgi:hypothetical protein
LAARARPCAARTRFFGLKATPNGALRAPPTCRSFAASYSTPKNTSQLRLSFRQYFWGHNYVPMRPNFWFFSFFNIFGSFLFVILFFSSLLFNFFLFFSSFLFLFFL